MFLFQNKWNKDIHILLDTIRRSRYVSFTPNNVFRYSVDLYAGQKIGTCFYSIRSV